MSAALYGGISISLMVVSKYTRNNQLRVAHFYLDIVVCSLCIRTLSARISSLYYSSPLHFVDLNVVVCCSLFNDCVSIILLLE